MPELSNRRRADYWALVRRWGETRRRSLDASLARYTLLPYNDAMSRQWAEISAHRRRLGKPIECGDAWIAASALRHSATLLTHNAKDYSDVENLRVVSHCS